MRFTRTLIDSTTWIVLVAFSAVSFQPSAVFGACAVAPRPASGTKTGPHDPAWTPPEPVRSAIRAAVPTRPVQPPDFKKRLAAAPKEIEVRQFRALDRPLISRSGRVLTDEECRATGRALQAYVDKAYDPPTARLQPLVDHLRNRPNSPFATSLWLETSSVAQQSGNFLLAVEAAREAWARAPQDAREGDEWTEAENALANLATLHARLGQRSALTELLAVAENRPAHPVSRARIAEARAALAFWAADPGNAALCGINAYNQLAERSGAPLLLRETQEWGGNTDADRAREAEDLKTRGMSAARLLARVQQTGADWRWIKRTAGSLIPSPAVIHLQFGAETGHYSALVAVNATGAHLVDPLLRVDAWVETQVLNGESSGFFMVPSSLPLPEGFAVATEGDLTAVYGRDSCPNGNDDEGCNTPPGKCDPGMAVATVSRVLPGLIIQDQPLTYEPLYGPSSSFRLEYRQVQLHGQNITAGTSHLGPLWSHDFLGFVRAADSSALPGNSTVHVHLEGTYFEYTRSGAAYVSRYPERPTLTELTTGGPGYRLTFADGSSQEFTQPNGPAPTRFYLKKITDAQGKSLLINYDSLLRIANITDATGKATTLGYNGNDLKIRSVTDPFGRTATFAYDAQGRLQSITDAIGIVSSFTYDDASSHPERIVALSTPYGTTTMAYEGEAAFSYSSTWAVAITDPEGFTSRVERFYHDGYTPFTSGDHPEPRPPASIQCGTASVPFLSTVAHADHFHVTCEWNKKQWYHYQADLAVNPNVNRFDYAHYTLWLMRPGSLYTSGVPIATKAPGESAVWYNYSGQTAGYKTGTSALPIKTARQVEDENGNLTWTVTQQTYNALGLPLVSTDERGRQTRINYAANNQDPVSIEVLTAAPDTWTTLRTYAYPSPSNHLPSALTDVSGLLTTVTRNNLGQITSAQISKDGNTENIQCTYTSSSLLQKIERTDPSNPGGFVTTGQFTYDTVGRLRTHTDAGGYVRTFDYDDFDRPTLITHPNGSTEQFAYYLLDLAATKDRAGRWSRTLYNPRRQPVTLITPDGDLTSLSWCLCGQLAQLTDPLGRVTKWGWDIGGRNTEKLMPDGITKTTFTYETRSGRLATVTRPNQQGSGAPTVTYRYHVDGSLRTEDYTDPDTPDVTYHYTTAKNGTVPDPLGRLTFVDDGIGTHTFGYVPLTAGTAGAGGLQYLNGPLVNDRIESVFDWQDRVSTENLLNDVGATNLRGESYTWDSLGQLKTVENALGTHTLGYATAIPTRLVSVNGPNSLTSTFAYLPNNAPGDSARCLTWITHQRAGVQQARHLLSYDQAGRITSWERQSTGQNTRKSTYTYNLGDELIESEERDLTANTLLDRETWGLDDGGNWLSHGRTTGNLMETRSIDTMNRLTRTGGAGSTVVEGQVNELSTVSVNGQPAEMRADPVAGGYRFRRSVPVSEGPNTITVTAADTGTPPATTTKSWSLNVPAVARNFTYDANGNTLSDGQRTFTWDAKNRLRTVTKNGTTWKWDYDYLDRRVREYTNGALTKQYVWSGTEIIQERNGSGSITRTHYFGGFSDGATPAGGTKYQTLTDHLGNIREVLSVDGTIAARYDYTPYQGPVKIGTSTVDPTFLTIGRYQHHGASGLELALYRAYDPDLGRWLSEDPMEFATGNIAETTEGPNLYSYVWASPVGFIDPLGFGKLKPFFKIFKFDKRADKVRKRVMESDFEGAVEAAQEGYDVKCPSRDDGYQVAKAASEPGNEPFFEVDKHGSHYHPNPRTGSHIFWSPFATLLGANTLTRALDGGAEFFNPLSDAKDFLEMVVEPLAEEWGQTDYGCRQASSFAETNYFY